MRYSRIHMIRTLPCGPVALVRLRTAGAHATARRVRAAPAANTQSAISPREPAALPRTRDPWPRTRPAGPRLPGVRGHRRERPARRRHLSRADCRSCCRGEASGRQMAAGVNYVPASRAAHSVRGPAPVEVMECSGSPVRTGYALEPVHSRTGSNRSPAYVEFCARPGEWGPVHRAHGAPD